MPPSFEIMHTPNEYRFCIRKFTKFRGKKLRKISLKHPTLPPVLRVLLANYGATVVVPYRTNNEQHPAVAWRLLNAHQAQSPLGGKHAPPNTINGNTVNGNKRSYGNKRNTVINGNTVNGHTVIRSYRKPNKYGQITTLGYWTNITPEPRGRALLVRQSARLICLCALQTSTLGVGWWIASTHWSLSREYTPLNPFKSPEISCIFLQALLELAPKRSAYLGRIVFQTSWFDSRNKGSSQSKSCILPCLTQEGVPICTPTLMNSHPDTCLKVVATVVSFLVQSLVLVVSSPIYSHSFLAYLYHNPTEYFSCNPERVPWASILIKHSFDSREQCFSPTHKSAFFFWEFAPESIFMCPRALHTR